MSNFTFHIDKKSISDMHEIMDYLDIDSYHDLFSKSLDALRIIAYISQTNGELIARKDSMETRIVFN